MRGSLKLRWILLLGTASVLTTPSEGKLHDVRQKTFRAAVYDSPPRPRYTGPRNPSRERVLKEIRPILQDYTLQAKEASEKGANIIVFPEYGLYPTGLSYDTMTSFCESIPAPELGWNPCHERRRFPDSEIQHHLSCLAFHYNLYVVANFGDKVPCTATRDNANCTSKQYNSNVAYDPSGRQVARYHKYNLFYERSYDTPPTPEHSYFDTHFGRLGTVICFDLLFHEPLISLIEDYAIDTVVFPSAWMNVLPYFSAVPFHGSFAIGAGVNLLSSNIHNPQDRFSGTGIYSPNKTLAFRNDDLSVEGALLIADLDSHPSKTQPVPLGFGGMTDEPSHISDNTFPSDVFGDVWTFTCLKPGEHSTTVCSGELCCQLAYELEATEEHYAVGAFDGLHTKEGTYYLQMCGLLRCGNEKESSCGDPAVRTSQTHFTYFSLSGNYSGAYRYPQVVTDNIDPASGQWSWDGLTLSAGRTARPLVSATVLTRLYGRDDEN